MQLESELLNLFAAPVTPHMMRSVTYIILRDHLRSLRVCTFTGELREIKTDEVDLTPWIDKILDPTIAPDNFAKHIASVLAEMRLLEIIK